MNTMQLKSTGQRVQLLSRVDVYTPDGSEQRLQIVRPFLPHEGTRTRNRAEVLTVKPSRVTKEED